MKVVSRSIMLSIILFFAGLGWYMHHNEINYSGHVHERGYNNGRLGTTQVTRDDTLYFNATISFMLAGLFLVGWILYERSEQ